MTTSGHYRPADKMNSVLASFRPDEIWPFLGSSTVKAAMPYAGWQVKTHSMRLHLFRQNPTCVVCGLTGSIFLLELSPGQQRPHLNFYAEQGSGVTLMTKDHIVPRSKGGSDYLQNLQTMCVTCNFLKADKEITVEELVILRGRIAEVDALMNRGPLKVSMEQLARFRDRVEKSWAA
jgi:5-methylcytosine-specific restriction endonuclease McrA